MLNKDIALTVIFFCCSQLETCKLSACSSSDLPLPVFIIEFFLSYFQILSRYFRFTSGNKSLLTFGHYTTFIPVMFPIFCTISRVLFSYFILAS